MRYNFICFSRYLPIVEITTTGNNIKEAVNNFNDSPQLVLFIEKGFLEESSIGNSKVWYYGDDMYSTRCIIFSEDSGYFNLHLYHKVPTHKGTNYFQVYDELVNKLIQRKS